MNHPHHETQERTHTCIPKLRKIILYQILIIKDQPMTTKRLQQVVLLAVAFLAAAQATAAAAARPLPSSKTDNKNKLQIARNTAENEYLQEDIDYWTRFIDGTAQSVVPAPTPVAPTPVAPTPTAPPAPDPTTPPITAPPVPVECETEVSLSISLSHSS